MTQNCFLGLGNPLLDISAVVDSHILDKYDLKLKNTVLAEEKHLPLYEELKNMPNVEYIAGGSTLNTMRVLQWFSHVPNVTNYIGCIGTDNFGQKLRECAIKDGVNPHFMLTDKENTGTCAVLIHNKERSLVPNLAAANCYNISHYKQPEILNLVQKAHIFYIAGYFLSVSPETILSVGEHCAKENKIMCMNLSANYVLECFKKPLSESLEYVDFIFGNTDEALVFANTEDTLKGKSVIDVAQFLVSLPKKNKNRKRVVIFTQGHLETIAVLGSGQIVRVPVEPLDHDKIVDLNGAGDAFVGGFLSCFLKYDNAENHIEYFIKMGHKAARYIIQTSGTKLEGEPDI